MGPHLLAESVIRSKKSIALAVNCRLRASPNSVHFPVRVVVIHHMKIAVSTSVNMEKNFNNNDYNKIS